MFDIFAGNFRHERREDRSEHSTLSDGHGTFTALQATSSD